VDISFLNPFVNFITLFAGLGILLFAGDLLVKGSVGLANKLSIPPLVIGLTIIAFGTSAPELVVSVKSAINGMAGLALGNVIGSNIANIFMVLGVPILFASILCNQKRAAHNIIILCVFTAIFTAMLFTQELTWIHGIILVAMLVFYLVDNARWAMKNRSTTGDSDHSDDMVFEEVDNIPTKNILIAVYILCGFIGLPIAAHLTVTSASAIATSLGVSDAVIGLTIIAVGTSLPELASTIAAVRQKQHDLGVGNIIGSNIFNIVAIVGITALIHPLSVPQRLVEFDIWVMILALIALLPFVLFKLKMGRGVGIMFSLAYATYIVSNFI